MRASFISLVLSAPIVFGQATADTTVTRVFNFHHIEKQQELEELGTMIRAIADVPQLSLDETKLSMSLAATPDRISIAEYLFTELDRQSLPDFATKDFHVAGSADDVVRVFFLKNTSTVQDFQEVATAIRVTTEMRRIFTLNELRALAVRGTADQVAGTEWLVRELIQPDGAKRTDSPVYKMIDPSKMGSTDVRVFYLPYTDKVQDFQEVATLVRTIAEIRQVFTYNGPKALILRGSKDQIALADWMVHELGKPVTAVASTKYTYVDPYDRNHENTVRIYYLPDTPTVKAFQQVATQIRVDTKMRRVFTYNPTRAMALRGTEAQLALADQMLHDRALQVASK
jgi:hypothetical protein